MLEFTLYSKTEEGKHVDLGLFIHKKYRGQGFAEILVHSVYTIYYFLNLPLIATVHEDNGRSLGLIRKLQKRSKQ